MKRIMIVDDEPGVRTSVRFLLEANGFSVVEASGGHQALEILKREKVDLVLIDFLMPEMSGRELAERIRGDPKLRDLKLVFLTVATLGEAGKEELKKLNILDYITKPYDNRDLVSRITRVLSK
ncbi:MAG: response regulator [Candidatus Hadarchaeales archaeon]